MNATRLIAVFIDTCSVLSSAVSPDSGRETLLMLHVCFDHKLLHIFVIISAQFLNSLDGFKEKRRLVIVRV
jgi:hypothetical protein